MKSIFSAFVIGALFSLGLIISQMVNPYKVLSFLDFFGVWDPSLLFFVLGAIPTVFAGYRMSIAANRPFFETRFRMPQRTDIDRELIYGAVIFGIGWGLTGLSIGPALAVMSLADPDIYLFLISALSGILLFRLFKALRHHVGQSEH